LRIRLDREDQVARLVALAAALAVACGAAEAGEFELGLGYDDVLGHNGGGAAAFLLQVRSEPRVELGPFGFGLGAAAEVDTHGDVWAGAGVYAYLPVGADFRLEGSVMAGLYAVGNDGTELGSGIEFRSRLGVSRAIREPWRVGLAIEHKSNGGIGDFNPGVETVFLTLSRRF
jgi:hypothetical protein